MGKIYALWLIHGLKQIHESISLVGNPEEIFFGVVI